ncbi:hypothetical protein OX284_010435 [Flavobacterium sp. SUN046]|uniref:hypothetical protein n=1 Tax=Flavobacterium sp. SUN046 TaxID=3002440 RepID=UPI002DB8DAF7|nr:hypothetical protein [Flavobacterium sp. SUN046]MEC4049846.1 hypothetical protein [Flavobacterium sp. SUN046]
MKKLIVFSLLFINCFIYSQKPIKVSNIEFKVKDLKKILVDEKVTATFRTLYKNNKIECGCIIKGVRNDSIFIKGSIQVKDKELICKEYYYYELKNYTDSIIRHFKLNKGHLIIKEYLRYNDGKIIYKK